MMWIRSMLIATAVASSLGLPHEWKLNVDGQGPRSQYYVTHKDGTFQYGYDTGDGAFESLKSPTAGEVTGAFGYVDEEGNPVQVTYESGQGGFVPKGDHLPQPPPELTEAFAAFRDALPFEDPLAGVESDRSYNFEFQSEDHSRNEVSDADGTVSGTYSYVDADGNLRKFRYTAGKGIGFVIEEEEDERSRPAAKKAVDKPLPPQDTSSEVLPPQPSITHRAAQQPSRFSPSFASRLESSVVAEVGTQKQPVPAVRTSGSSDAAQHEDPDAKVSLLDDGSYYLSYRTDLHSRDEEADRDNSVKGSFSFVADDDGIDRSITYIAGSDTGFIAEGDHIPVGPVVPGAPSGQPTGRLVKVSEEPFEDPLANPNPDASYTYEFQSDSYSRSESSDAEGNVVGTYTVVDEDGTQITYSFRAGKGIGFQVEEVDRKPGTKPSEQHKSSTSHVAAVPVAQTRSAVQSAQQTFQGTRRASVASPITSNEVLRKTSISQPSQPASQPREARPTLQTSSSSQDEDLENFQLMKLEFSPDAEKYGYVIRYEQKK